MSLKKIWIDIIFHTMQNEILLYVQQVLSIFCNNSLYRKGQEILGIQYFDFHFSLTKSFQSLDSMCICCTPRKKKKKKYAKTYFWLKVLPTPGHTNDSVSLKVKTKGKYSLQFLTDKKTTFKAKTMQVKGEAKISTFCFSKSFLEVEPETLSIGNSLTDEWTQ